MIDEFLPEFITALGALLTSSASLIAAIVAARKATQAKGAATAAAQELAPNHGSSMSDAVRRIEEMVRSQGKQIGEIRADANVVHEILAHRLDDQADRLGRLEDR